jgi:streptogrisin C
MQRRRIAAIAAAVTAAGAAISVTVPSMADTNGSGGSAARPAVAPRLLAAMKRDLGVDADRATARVKRAQWAAGVATRLRNSTGNAYAGAWLTGGGMTLTVGVTGAAAAQRVRAAGAVPKTVDRSVAQLDAAKRALDRAATRADRALPGWYVDVAANQVAIQALPGQAARVRKLAADAGIPASAVRVVAATARPRPLFDVVGAQPYFISVSGGTARCSIGFAVSGGFVTAGHCGTPGNQTAGFNQQAQGEVVASVFPGDADMGVVSVNGDWTPTPFVDDFDGSLLPVAGSTESPVGAPICRSGSTSGTHCGTILARNQTVNYAEGAVTGLTRTDVCAEAGDSGGPWLTGDQAQGVTSGGFGDCTSGGETFFQPVNEILQRNDLTLLTTTGESAAAPAASPATPQRRRPRFSIFG